MSVRGFFSRRIKIPPDRSFRDQLPLINSFVEIAINGSHRSDSVSINDVKATSLVTRRVEGLAPGVAVDFVYTNDFGKFHFKTVCSQVEASTTTFDLPATIRTIEAFADRRRASRVPWIIPVEWRYAPDGAGYGEFQEASMMDLSWGGASLVVGRELKTGSHVEIRFALKSKTKPFTELCQVVRAAKIETSDKNAAGIRFVEIDHEDEKILSEFVNERQALRRDRGVV